MNVQSIGEMGTMQPQEVAQLMTGSNPKDAFVLLDPPYYPVTTNISKLYGSDFPPVEFIRIRKRCDALTRHGVKFMLFNSDCEFIRELFSDYNLIPIKETRAIKASKGKGSKPSADCLIITNYTGDKLMEVVERCIETEESAQPSGGGE